MAKIFVSGLKLNCIIGIYPKERVEEQELLVDLTFEVPDAKIKETARTGDLACSVNYAEAADKVRTYIVQRKAELLEELSCELCSLLLEAYPVIAAVTVRLTKTQAVPGTDGTGIEFTQMRSV